MQQKVIFFQAIPYAQET